MLISVIMLNLWDIFLPGYRISVSMGYTAVVPGWRPDSPKKHAWNIQWDHTISTPQQIANYTSPPLWNNYTFVEPPPLWTTTLVKQPPLWSDHPCETTTLVKQPPLWSDHPCETITPVTRPPALDGQPQVGWTFLSQVRSVPRRGEGKEMAQ